MERSLEDTSAGIFDKTAILFEDEEFQNKYVRIPSFSVIVKQLIEWKIIDIPKAYKVVYNELYSKLSKNVHVIPDRTDIGRRLLLEKGLFKIGVVSDELNKFMKNLFKVIDIGIVIELNILSDWIKEDKEVQTNLKERLKIIENLGLRFSSDKLSRLTSG